MYNDAAGWIKAYMKKGALWFHDENMKRPHALLTSGKHSSGFFNSECVMEDSLLLDQACLDLVQMLAMQGAVNINNIDRVVGPAMGAVTLAHSTSVHISRARGRVCLRAFTEKEIGLDGVTRMVFKRTAIRPGERILIVEDVLTTGGSVDLTESAILEAGGTVLPFVAVLVNRSGLKEVGGKGIVSLIDRSMPIWGPEECPLCKQGSEAIRPKGVDNWARLNASY